MKFFINKRLRRMFAQSDYINPHFYFFIMYGILPFRKLYSNIIRETLYPKLTKKCKQTVALTEWINNPFTLYTTCTFLRADGILVHFPSNHHNELGEILVLYKPKLFNSKVIEELSELILSCQTKAIIEDRYDINTFKSNLIPSNKEEPKAD